MINLEALQREGCRSLTGARFLWFILLFLKIFTQNRVDINLIHFELPLENCH